MKKTSRILLTVFLVAAMLFIGLVAAALAHFDWVNHKRPTLIDTEISPDGGYSLRLEQIGEPMFFAPASARITLWRSEGSQPLNTLEASVSNDGAGLHPETWLVEWQADRVTVTLRGCEQPDAIYTLPLP